MTVKAELGSGSDTSPPDTSPPAAVSFFDPSLNEIRKRVFYQWARTCKRILEFGNSRKQEKLTESTSVDFVRLCVCRVISLLGSPVRH